MASCRFLRWIFLPEVQQLFRLEIWRQQLTPKRRFIPNETLLYPRRLVFSRKKFIVGPCCRLRNELSQFCRRKYSQYNKYQSYVYWTVHRLDSWIESDQLDVTCFFISLFNAQPNGTMFYIVPFGTYRRFEGTVSRNVGNDLQIDMA